MIVTSDQPKIKAWICNKLRWTPTPEMMAIGKTDANGNIVGAVGYDNYNGAICEVHTAGEPAYLTKEFLRVVCDYPFNVLGCSSVMATVDSSNVRSKTLLRRMGFKELAVVEHGTRTGNLHIMQLKRQDCRWLEV